MNPELPPNPREELELRVTSLLLGELSAAEAAAVRAALAQDSELQKLHDDLKQTIHLVREATVSVGETAHEASAPLKLSEARRKSLLAAFVIPPLKPEHIKAKRWERQWLVPGAAVATILAVLGVWMFIAPRRESEGYLAFNEERESLATAQPRRVTPLSGQRPEDGRGNSDGVETLGQPEVTTISGRAAKASEQKDAKPATDVKFRTWGKSASLRGYYDDSARPSTPPPAEPVQLEPSVTSILAAEPKLAPPPMEIVLPKSGDGDALEIAGTSGVAAGDSFFAGGGRGGGGAGTVDASAPLQGRDIPVKYANPANVQQALQDIFADGRSQAVVDSGGGKVTILGSDKDGETAEDLVRKLDTPSKQVLVEGTFTDHLRSLKNKAATPAGAELPAQPGDASIAANGKVAAPVLGDVPVVGHLFEAAPAATGSPGGEPADALNKSGTGTLTHSGGTLALGEKPPPGQVTIAGKDYDRELVGYDDPGQFVPQAQAASGSAGVAGLPITAQMPVPHYRLKPVESAAAAGETNVYSLNVVGFVNVDQAKLRALDIQAATNSMGDSEWAGSLESASKPKDAGNQFVGRYAYITPTESESLARGKRESNIVLPETPTPAKPSAPDNLLTAGSRDANRSLADDGNDLGVPLHLGEEFRRTDLRRAKETQPYYDKKRELDELVGFQKILEQRLAMEKVDVSLPRTGMVTIMNRATAPKSEDRGVLGRILDSNYKATASVRLDRSSADIAEFSGARMSGVYDPYFIQTEMEAMKSEAVLTNVVSRLGLTNKWASKGNPLTTAQAVAKLRGSLELRPVKNTMFTEIQAKSSDPTEAATIANAVAEAYRDHRLAEIRRSSESGIRALAERFEEQQAKVKKAAQELAALREGSKSSAPSNVLDAPLPRKPATNAPVPQPEIQTSENNFSTFSLNVSDVSFKLAAASLEKGQMPDAASIRSEEFINAFDYRDPEASAGSPVAFAWERARYPFAHNRDLLRFSIKTAAVGRQAGRPLNIVLLLDNSGSMERADRVGIIREALRVLASQLQPQDKLSVITFARSPQLVADGITGDKAGEVTEQVSGLTPEGGTNLEDAMNLAYQTAAKHYLASGINRVVVLTDGAANLGNVEPESLKHAVEAQRQQGIALDCFGIGWEGFNDDLLEVLSRNGDGRYGFINSPEEAASEFAGQLAGALKVAASDVKVQVEFNPKRVTSYRQIGYAKHQLTKEQFRDNTVDAAEIAAQEAGNALYTVEVNPAGEGPLGTVHVRYKIPGTTDYREQAWDVPFTGGAVSMEQASPAMRLATTASAFSEWLAVSPHAGEVTPDALLNYLSGVPEVFGADSRPKKLEWMIRQAKSLEGK